MRQLAVLATSVPLLVPLLGGCSFIYNPDHINRDIDAQLVDVEMVVDVNPAGLKLTYAYPGTVYEGAGTGGSRPALVVIRGEEIAESATVSIVPMTGDPSQIVVNETKIAADHRWIAASITVPVDMNQDETTDAGGHMADPVPLIITVDNGGGHTVSMPMTALTLQWLDQLKAPPATLPDPMANKRYSVIDMPATATFGASATAHRIELHSMSSINFGAGIVADANGGAPGPGGCAGGAAQVAGASTTPDGATCSPGQGGGLLGGGGAGGYAQAGEPGGNGGAGGAPVGEPQLLSLKKNVAGSGGGGSGTTAVGGGGGGSVVLIAEGNLTITKTGTSPAISANGGKGGNGAINLTGGGGAGAGGTIFLRAGGTMTINGTLSNVGNVGGSGLGVGGNSHEGRTRWDAGAGSAPSGYQGPMILTMPYYSAVQVVPSEPIVVGGPAGNSTDFTGLVYDKDNGPVPDSDFSLLFGPGTAKPSVKLTAGYNRVCVKVPGGNVLTNPESGNCAEIAFLPPATQP